MPPKDTPINTGLSPLIPARIRPAYSPTGSLAFGVSQGSGKSSVPGSSNREKMR